jgi:hypothetical protein
MDFYVITPRGTELLISTVEGKVLIVPPAVPAPAAAPAQPGPDKQRANHAGKRQDDVFSSRNATLAPNARRCR